MSTPLVHLSLDATYGAMFVGVMVAGTLYGVSCVQTWMYYTRYPEDLWYIKLLVGMVVLFDTIHQALISHCMYVYVITNYGNPPALGDLVWSLIVEVFFNGFIALLVQLFLTMRVWRLSNRNIPLTVVLLLLVFGEFGCVLAYGIQSLHYTSFRQLRSLKELSISVNALAAIGDVLIAGVLCYVLHTSRTGFQRSDTIINKLIIFAVNTGLLTSICAVASLISITVAGDTFVYICFFFILGRLYSNSLLATLNARKMIRAAANNSDDLSMSLKDLGNAHTVPSFNVGHGSAQLPTQISIKITNTQEYSRDADYGTSGNRGTGGEQYHDHDIDVDEASQTTMEKVAERMNTEV